MPQNTSSAVMAQRRQSTGDLDFFPTPPWGVRALQEYVLNLDGASVWECACGRGHMSRALTEFASTVVSSDIVDRGFGRVFDFLSLDGLGLTPAPFGPVDWIITNPPFGQLHRFVEVALRAAGRGVAILGRLQLLEGVARYETIYRPYAGHFTVAPFVERLPMEEGCVASDTSTATAYAWLVVDKAVRRPSPLIHIPPCRARLEQPGDYDPPDHVARIRALKAARGKALDVMD